MENENGSNLCRICLESGATIPIFESIGINNVQFKLSSCINEKVDDVEGYPRNICFTCDNTLDMVCNFINKFRESSNILKSGLAVIKQELNHEYSDNETSIDFNEFKSEPIDEDEKTLAELLQPLKIKIKKVKVEMNSVKKATKRRTKKPNQNETNKIASSILEGDFSWTGQKWCFKLGETTIRKKYKKNNKSQKEKVSKAAEKIQNVKEKIPKVKVKERLCDLCGEVFPNQDRLSIHQKVTHFKSPINCPMCQKILVSPYYLNRHIKRKHKPKDLPCPSCDRKFAFKSELKTHIKNVHNKHLKPKKIYSCKICNKTYLCSKSVVVHERSVHTGHRPAECTICGSRFYHEDYLKEHMRLHTGETPFKCPICDRGYAQRCNMKSHLRIHRMSELDAATLNLTLDHINVLYINVICDSHTTS
ncbi:hypothetical protein K1T71_008181 [Dendrolimus kikuchii]|uniref:Uncharacterized protein n=1 Tax=Dendrolimus kikuchii TaxID=765133 RepID=A0ACC1CXK6_9NEOP|nr:hypothetical protein K1T71_008181 [Dendrolimus kikuchii]